MCVCKCVNNAFQGCAEDGSDIIQLGILIAQDGLELSPVQCGDRIVLSLIINSRRILGHDQGL